MWKISETAINDITLCSSIRTLCNTVTGVITCATRCCYHYCYLLSYCHIILQRNTIYQYGCQCCHHHHLSLSCHRVHKTSVTVLQHRRSCAFFLTTAQDNLRSSNSFSDVLRHVALGRPLLHLSFTSHKNDPGKYFGCY